MNLPRASVRRPIFTTMVTLIVVLLGLVSLSRLRIDLFPAIELPTLTVRAEYEGASPEVMERLVTRILEEILATVQGVEEMTSMSSEGRTNIRLAFSWGRDLDTAAEDVRAILEAEANELPDEVTRPTLRKFDIASFPVVILGVSSALDPVELTELVDRQIRHRFARLPGVAQVDMWGEYQREVRVEVGPARLRALGLPLDRVLAAIRDSNLDLPAGQIDEGRFEVTLRAPAEFADLDELRATVVAVRDGAPVTLSQIGEVVDTWRKRSRIVRVDGSRGLRVAIRKQADANTVEVSTAVLAEIERIAADYPQVRIVPVSNQGNFIERSIQNVARSVLYGGGLAIFVLLFFLRSLRSTVVISVAIPISIIATFALVYFGGFTLNLMTLGGLALGVGMMVDSSIVVLENVFRRRDEMGEPGRVAAVEGAREVAPAILASTLTTLVIFLPLVFVRGVTGFLFQELAYVIAFSLACSLVVAISVVPMLASRLLPGSGKEPAARPGLARRVAGLAEAALRGLEHAYGDLLRAVLRLRGLTALGSVLLLGASLLLVPLIGTEFLPPSDEGEVRVTGEMEVGTRLSIVDRQTRIMEDIVIPEVPELVASVVTVGATGFRADATTQGEIALTLRPAAERSRSNGEVADALRNRLAGKVPGMELRVRAPQGQFLMNRILGEEEGLKVEVRGDDLQTLDMLAARVAAAIRDVPGITDVQTSREAGVPQETFRIDRDKAADLGLTVRQVSETLETAIAGRQAGEFRPQGRSYRILVQLADVENLSIDEILDLTLTGTEGQEVALRNVVEVTPSRGPTLIDRKDQERMVTVTANVSGRDEGSVAHDIERRLITIPRPVGYDLRVAGSFEEQNKAFGELLVSLGLALLLVYMVLACQYESLVDPLVVMMSVPFAAIGVLLVLFLTGTTLNVQSFIGCIMLGGIVVNNAILLVDQAGQLRQRDGLSTDEAITEAGRRRLRPILMTTATTMLGLLPLALGIGEGADAQAPLARAVIGGLFASTGITLLLIPAVYSVFHRGRARAPAAQA